jgi:hypothetical protein
MECLGRSPACCLSVITYPHDFENEPQRRRAVAWAVALAATFAPAPQAAEPADDAALYQVLYWSEATSLSKGQLLALLEQARRHNVAHHVTGVLLYSEGRFVQIIEGPAGIIRPLLGRIQADTRHHTLEIVRAGPIAARHFAEWTMDFGFASQAVGEPPADLPSLSITSGHLKQLLEVFIG